MSSNHLQKSFNSLFTLSSGLVLLSIALTYRHPHDWSWLGKVGWWAIPWSVGLAFTLFYGLVVLASHRWFGRPSFYHLIKQLHQLTRSLTGWQIVLLSVMAGVGEELLFRGFIQSWFNTWVGAAAAIVISSLIFALLHAMTLYYFSLALFISAVFGWLFTISQSMLLVVMLHAVYDILALLVIAKYPHYLGVDAIVENELEPDQLTP